MQKALVVPNQDGFVVQIGKYQLKATMIDNLPHFSYANLAKFWGYTDFRKIAQIVKRNGVEFEKHIKEVIQDVTDKNGIAQKRTFNYLDETGLYLVGFHCKTKRGIELREIASEIMVAVNRYMNSSSERQISLLQSDKRVLEYQLKKLQSESKVIRTLREVKEAGIYQDVKEIRIYNYGPCIIFHPS